MSMIQWYLLRMFCCFCVPLQLGIMEGSWNMASELVVWQSMLSALSDMAWSPSPNSSGGGNTPSSRTMSWGYLGRDANQWCIVYKKQVSIYLRVYFSYFLINYVIIIFIYIHYLPIYLLIIIYLHALEIANQLWANCHTSSRPVLITSSKGFLEFVHLLKHLWYSGWGAHRAHALQPHVPVLPGPLMLWGNSKNR